MITEMTLITVLCVAMLLSGGYAIYLINKDLKELQKIIEGYLEELAIESQRTDEIRRDALESLSSDRSGEL